MTSRVRPPVPAPGWFQGLPVRAAVWLTMLLGLGLCGHCNFGGFTPPPTPKPEIQGFTAARATVTRGDSTELTATFQGGEGTVDPGVGPVASGSATTVGPLLATTTFTLAVTGPGGAASAQVTVTVVAPPDATITGPPSVTAGQTGYTASVPVQDGAAFAWTIRSGSLDGAADGRTVSFASAAFGLLQLTCTVTNAAGLAASGTFTAPLGGSTIFSFSAAPAVISAGGSATLSYAFSGGAGVLTPGAQALGTGTDTLTITGTRSVSPGASTAYALTVTDGAGHVASAAAPVTVVPLPGITSFTASPGIIGTGSATSLTAVFNAGPGGRAYVSFGGDQQPVTSGTPVTTPDLASSTSFTLTVLNAAGSAATAQVPVLVGDLDTFAGVPSGEGSLDGFGAQARFDHPVGAALDAGGNLLVADTRNHTIRKVFPDGQVLTLAGSEGVPGSQNGVEGAAGFNLPVGIAVDPINDNVYVTDSGNGLVRAITPDGTVSTLAGSAGLLGSADGTAAGASFDQPTGIAERDDGSLLFVADTGNDEIRQILLSSRAVTTLAGTAGQPGLLNSNGDAALFRGPAGLLWDATTTGSLFVADALNNEIRRVDNRSFVSLVAGDPAGLSGTALGLGPAADFSGPQAVAADALGHFYVADTGNSRILGMTFNGTYGTLAPLAGTAQAVGSADGPGASASFNHPAGLVANGAGDLFVVDTGNSEIRVIPAGGQVATLCGAPPRQGYQDGAGAQARLDGPTGLARDGHGTSYVGDTGNNAIRRIAPGGALTTLAGDPHGLEGFSDSTAPGSAAGAQFKGPAGVSAATAPNGAVTVYVADAGNNAIRRIAPDGTVTTLAGDPDGTAGFSDSTAPGSAAGARFKGPAGVAAVVAAGGAVTVYVADTGNNAIRRIGPDGTVSTVAGDPGRTGAVDGPAGGPAVAFTRPGGVTASADGRTLYVADTGNHLVRLIRGGAVSTLAGSAGVAGSQDGAGAAARLNAPAAIALDGSGNLYVANTGSSTVCQITPAGTVTTILGNGTLSANFTGPLPALIARPQGIAVDQPTSDIYITIDDAVMKVDFHP